MPGESEWLREIGRRLRLRDLQIVFAVADCGSMAKAAAELGVTQSAVSQTIAGLEADLGVRLFDRSRQGVTPTVYGEALIRRGKAAFDEFRSGFEEINLLRDAGAGRIRIGCPETLAASILPPAIERFSQQWPGVRFEVETFTGPEAGAKLLDRSIDLVLARDGPALETLAQSHDFQIRRLFEDRLSVVVARGSRWARQRKVALADLADAPWIVLPYGWGQDVIPSAFAAQGLPPPPIAVTTFSIHLRLHLLQSGRYVTALPESVLRLHGARFDLTRLPIDLPRRPYGVAIITLRNRTLMRLIEHFIDFVTEQHRAPGLVA